MTSPKEQVYEIRLKLDTTNSWSEAVEIAQKIEMQIKKFADHTNTIIDWRDRAVEVLGAPHLLIKAPEDFISKIVHFPEVISIEPAIYPTKPRSDDSKAPVNDNGAEQKPMPRAIAPKPPKM